MRYRLLRCLSAGSLLLCLSVSHAETLETVVKKTLLTHPDILIARSNERAADHAHTQAKAGFFPSIDLSAARGRENTLLPTNDLWVPLVRTEKKVTVTQLLFDAWGTQNNTRSASEQYTAARFQTWDQMQNAALKAVGAYLDVIRYRRLCAVAGENAALHRKMLATMNARYKGGAGDHADVELARSRLSLSLSMYSMSRRLQDNANAAFLAIVGAPPAATLVLPAHARSHIPAELVPALKVASENHPSIKVVLAQYRASRFARWSAQSTFAPKVTLQASKSKSRNMNGVEGPLNHELLSVGVSYNLFRGGADRAQVDQAEEKIRIAQQNLEKVRRGLRESVTYAWNNYHTSVLRYGELVKRVTATQAVVSAYKQQFELGSRPLLNLMDTQTELFTARSDAINGEFDLLKDAYTLYSSMGILYRCITE